METGKVFISYAVLEALCKEITGLDPDNRYWQAMFVRIAHYAEIPEPLIASWVGWETSDVTELCKRERHSNEGRILRQLIKDYQRQHWRRSIEAVAANADPRATEL